jgi:hypothetical protein
MNASDEGSLPRKSFNISIPSLYRDKGRLVKPFTTGLCKPHLHAASFFQDRFTVSIASFTGERVLFELAEEHIAREDL